MREWQQRVRRSAFASSAARGSRSFAAGTPILANVSGLGDRPHIKDLIGSVEVMLDAYTEGKVDRVFMVNAKFVNTMTQQPVVEQLLPVQPVDTEGLQEHWDYIYEPEAKDISTAVDALRRVTGVSRRC